MDEISRYHLIRRRTTCGEPDLHSLAPSMRSPYGQHPYDSALPEVGSVRIENDGFLPDMAGAAGGMPSDTADRANLTATASSQLLAEPPAPISSSSEGGGADAKAEHGDIWWNDDVPVAQV